jgi:hypothetical protein
MPKRDFSAEHSDWVLVTAEVNGVGVVWFAQYGFLDRSWWDPEGRAVPGVTAWHELPEPFHRPMPKHRAAAGYMLSESSAR